MRGLSLISDSDASNPTRASGHSSISDLPSPLFGLSAFLCRFHTLSLATLKNPETNQPAVQPAVDAPSRAPNSPAILHMNRIGSYLAKVLVNPFPPVHADALLPQFSTPSPYIALNSATPYSQQDAVIPSSNIPFDTLHKYKLTSRGRDYATVVVVIQAPSVLDPPVLHLGDELDGRIVLRSDNLSDMRSMEVVFRLIEYDPVIASHETKRTLLSQEVDESYPVPTPSPPLIPAVRPSDLSVDPPCLPVILSWPQQILPAVVVRGVMFRRLQVEVRCKLIVPVSHPVSDVIPLHLVVTSESREVLDRSPYHMSSTNRFSRHRTDWAAKAQWKVNARPLELPPSDEHPRARWNITLNGMLHRDQSV
ncbi:hypothetical protein BJY52DRAFT_1188959 [Lactarius psammicola]|nr:hypothetical protein BJY52DRAFT_1188959 [Lactarius psammicola]